MKKSTGVIIFSASFLMLLLFSVFVYAANPLGISWGDIFKGNDKIINIQEYGAAGDGVTDDSDVIQSAFDEAITTSRTVYFPAGNYLVAKTLSLDYSYGRVLVVKGVDKESVKIIGAESLAGAVVKSQARSGLYFKDISFEHKGKGSCIDALFLDANNCSFYSGESNSQNMVIFTGSNCRIEKCTFNGENEKAYALCHTKRPDIGNEVGSGVAINCYIIDNTFTGKSKGVLVDSKEIDNRVEGLKIQRNVFENTGAEQITVQTILHCDISNNIMKGSKGSAIVFKPEGLLVHGVYICNNTISATRSCVYEANGNLNAAVINVCNNRLENSAFGVNLNSPIGYLTVDNNVISEISDTGIAISKVPYTVVTNNKVLVKEGANSVQINATDAWTVIAGNEVNVEMKNNISGGKTIIKEE